MAKQVLKDALIVIGNYDVSGNHNTLALTYAADTPEGTAFGDNTHGMLPGGLKSVGVAADGFWDCDSNGRPDLTYQERIGATAVGMLLSANRSQGDICYVIDEILASYNPINGTVGDPHQFSIDAMSSYGSDLIRSTLMENITQGSSADGTSRQIGAVSATQTLYGGLFVTAASGSSPTLDVIVESDASGAFSGSETTRLTFAQATAQTHERLTLAGPVTDTYWRASWTIGGGSPSFTFLLALGIA